MRRAMTPDEVKQAMERGAKELEDRAAEHWSMAPDAEAAATIRRVLPFLMAMMTLCEMLSRSVRRVPWWQSIMGYDPIGKSDRLAFMEALTKAEVTYRAMMGGAEEGGR